MYNAKLIKGTQVLVNGQQLILKDDFSLILDKETISKISSILLGLDAYSQGLEADEDLAIELKIASDKISFMVKDIVLIEL